MSSRAISGNTVMSQGNGVLGRRSPRVCIGDMDSRRRITTLLRTCWVCHDDWRVYIDRNSGFRLQCPYVDMDMVGVVVANHDRISPM